MLGTTYPMLIGDEERAGSEHVRRSLADRHATSWSAASRSARGEDVRDAVDAARAAYPAWRDLGWRKRLEILRRAADLISERQFLYAALMSFEVGKNRLEALGDVEETADLIRYYGDTMEAHDGFVQPMGSLSRRRAHPQRPQAARRVGHHQPLQLPDGAVRRPGRGRAAGRQHGGHEAVLGRAADGLPVRHACCARSASRPASSTWSPGPGETVGAELEENPGIDGMVFTGSYEVGMRLYKSFTRDYPRPIITEMGGKNPAIVTRNADLDMAAEGVMRSAFGFDGQKCSANSRVYVDRSVAGEFVDEAGGEGAGDPRR